MTSQNNPPEGKGQFVGIINELTELWRGIDFPSIGGRPNRPARNLRLVWVNEEPPRVQCLVEIALRGQAPAGLVHHFSMIGRDYYELADHGPGKPKLRTIEGGKA